MCPDINAPNSSTAAVSWLPTLERLYVAKPFRSAFHTHAPFLQYKQALLGLGNIHERNGTHGDAASRNLIVPHDDPFTPVWIDMWPQVRDVECAATWQAAIRQDILPLDVGVFTRGGVECRPCIEELDAWCQQHIAHYIPLSEAERPPTGAAKERAAARHLRIRGLEARERLLRNSIVAELIEGGLTFETNIPPETLVDPSSLVWKDRASN